MKTEVYSWRVSADLKTGLEREARRRKVSLSAVLDLATREWLEKSGAEMDGADEQRRLHKAASNCFGSISGDDAQRAENARETLRKRLRQRHGH